jgi:hypothetical protein
MRMLEQVTRDSDAAGDAEHAEGERPTGRDWADRTRRVLTRDLLRRAAQVSRGESRALQFRALHLNLPLVGEAAERLELTQAQRTAAEHHALDGLVEAIRAFDPDGEVDFADFAVRFVEQQILAHLPRATLRLTQPRRSTEEVGRPVRSPRFGARLAVRRFALVIAGSHA